MSLITRCPACATMFKVVPDQLRISEGWVRCGHCSEVFDATAQLQHAAATASEPPAAAVDAEPDQGPAPAPTMPGAPPMALAQPAFAAAVEASPIALPLQVPAWGAEAAAHAPPALREALPAGDSAWQAPWAAPGPQALREPEPPEPEPAEPEPAEPELPEPEPREPEPRELEPPEPQPLDETAQRPSAREEHEAEQPALTEAAAREESFPEPQAEATALADERSTMAPEHEEPSAEPPAGAPVEAAAQEPAAGPAAEDPTESTLQGMSFVREAQRKAFWRRPLVRAGLLLVCLLLLAGLGLQVALHQRDRLAAADPQFKAWLLALCEPLGCSVEPLRLIEAMAVESSSFNKVRGDAYRLGVSVRNRSPLALAMPGIELTLTDAQDRPVVRRVLLPAELGAAPVLAAGAEWSGSLPVTVAAAGGARIAGYRVLAFYP